MSWSWVGLGGGHKDLNFLQKLMWEFRASSSSPVLLWDLTTSSLTASAHSPQIQRPRNLSRTLLMYASVHSSVNPQHSHLANSKSLLGLLLLLLDDDIFVMFKLLASGDVWVSIAVIFGILSRSWGLNPADKQTRELGDEILLWVWQVFLADKSEGFFFFLKLNLWKEDSIFLSPTLLLLQQSHHQWSRAWIPYTFQSLVWLFEIGFFTLESRRGRIC